jgi:hypothetical protein
VATTGKKETTRLANELSRVFGDEPITARALAEELVVGDRAVDLITLFEDAVACRAAAGEDDTLDDTLWGLPPTSEELRAARETANAAVGEALDEALSDALSREEAGRRLGISPQAVSKRRAAGQLVALERGRERFFPAWQFREDAVLPGLADVIDVYPGTPLSLTVWATSPCADLDGRTPAQTLTRRDGVQQVLEAATALTTAAW